jgi:hypothetical protein
MGPKRYGHDPHDATHTGLYLLDWNWVTVTPIVAKASGKCITDPNDFIGGHILGPHHHSAVRKTVLNGLFSDAFVAFRL